MRAPVAIASVLFASMFSACTPASAARWVPTMVVHGEIVRARGASTLGTPQRWDWRAGLALRWSPAPELGARETQPEPRRERLEEPGSVCAHASLCAWEQRSQARALGRWESRR